VQNEDLDSRGQHAGFLSFSRASPAARRHTVQSPPANVASDGSGTPEWLGSRMGMAWFTTARQGMTGELERRLTQCAWRVCYRAGPGVCRSITQEIRTISLWHIRSGDPARNPAGYRQGSVCWCAALRPSFHVGAFMAPLAIAPVRPARTQVSDRGGGSQGVLGRESPRLKPWAEDGNASGVGVVAVGMLPMAGKMGLG
jgi:hypothetical protein